MKRALNQVNYEMLVGLCPEIMTSDEGGWLVLTIADTQIEINVMTVTDDARELSLECLCRVNDIRVAIPRLEMRVDHKAKTADVLAYNCGLTYSPSGGAAHYAGLDPHDLLNDMWNHISTMKDKECVRQRCATTLNSDPATRSGVRGAECSMAGVLTHADA